MMRAMEMNETTSLNWAQYNKLRRKRITVIAHGHTNDIQEYNSRDIEIKVAMSANSVKKPSRLWKLVRLCEKK